MSQRDSRQAVDRGDDPGETEIQLRVLDRRLVGLELGQGGEISLDGIVEFFLADGLFTGQRGVAVDVQFGLLRLGLILGKLCPSLIEGGLKGAGINLEKQITRFHLGALLVTLGEQITGDLRADLRVHQPVQRTDPFFEDGNIRRGDGDDLNLGR